MMKNPKTICLHVPRFKIDEATAVIITTWNIYPQRLFEHMLNELAVGLGEPFAMETWVSEQTLHFCITAEWPTIDILKAAIYSQYGDAELVEIEDFTSIDTSTYAVASREFNLGRSSVYSIVTYLDLSFGSIATLVNVLQDIQADEQAIFQLVVKGTKDNTFFNSKIRTMKANAKFWRSINPKYWFKSGVVEDLEEAVEKKCNKRLFEVNLRVAFAKQPNPDIGLDGPTLQSYLDDVMANFLETISLWNKADHNFFTASNVVYGEKALDNFKSRALKKPFFLYDLELVTMWFPPSAGDVRRTKRVLFNRGPLPQNIPTNPEDPNNCLFASSNYRGDDTTFGLNREDRRGHCYILGKSGSGKSYMLQNLIRADMQFGHGLAVLDPHGDLVDDILKLVPEHRVKDVIVLDPSDYQFPPSFNPLARVPDELKMRVTIGIVEIFQKLLGNAWSDRLEHVLRYTTLSLLSTRGTTILSIRRMLVDERYRLMVASNIEDSVLRSFWLQEFPEWAAKYHDEAVTPLLDKIGEFVTTNMIRNMVGQPINRFDFREIMDNRKILLIKVSKGILGDENSSLLGAMIVAKIYQAAMSRADTPLEQRQDFYFYVDEFHNFATDSFNEILSESRKYRLNLTVANQFIGQIPESIRKTILGNVSNLCTFRVGGDDAEVLAKEFQPKFCAEDILNLEFRHFYLKTTVDGQSQQTFSGRTIDVVHPLQNYATQCIERSRQEYALPIEQVEEVLRAWESENLELMHGEGALPKANINLRRHLRRNGKLLFLSFSDVTDDDLSKLSEEQYKDVIDLHLTDTCVSNAGLRELKKLPKLRSLRLDDTMITDESLAHLGKLKRLQRLVLDNTQITDRGLSNIEHLPIKQFSAQGTLLTDKAIATLERFPELKELRLNGTQISAAQAKHLKSLRPNLRIKL